MPLASATPPPQPGVAVGGSADRLHVLAGADDVPLPSGQPARGRVGRQHPEDVGLFDDGEVDVGPVGRARGAESLEADLHGVHGATHDLGSPLEDQWWLLRRQVDAATRQRADGCSDQLAEQTATRVHPRVELLGAILHVVAHEVAGSLELTWAAS